MLPRRFHHPLIGRFALYYFSGTITIYTLLILLPDLLGPNIFASKTSVLLVTAHPDDETLFFSPLITAILKSETPFRVLTLSKGGNYGKGATREQEMENACRVYEDWALARKPGLPMDVPSQPIHCDVLEVSQDDPRAHWDEGIILQEIGTYVQTWKIDAIVTFDEGGIFGHENHKSIARVLVRQAKVEPSFTPVYTLYTTTLLRKYTFLFDLPPTMFPILLSKLGLSTREHILYVNSFDRWRTAVRAFGKHASQFSWDRIIFLGLNRYMWFSAVERVMAI